jgi:hypothetical protein
MLLTRPDQTIRVSILCLRPYDPPASCCYSLPTVILSSSLLLPIRQTIANRFYTQLLLISAFCCIILQPPLAYWKKTTALAASGVPSQNTAPGAWRWPQTTSAQHTGLRSGSQDHHPSKNSVQKTICCNSISNAPDGGRMYPKHVELRIH